MGSSKEFTVSDPLTELLRDRLLEGYFKPLYSISGIYWTLIFFLTLMLNLYIFSLGDIVTMRYVVLSISNPINLFSMLFISALQFIFMFLVIPTSLELGKRHIIEKEKPVKTYLFSLLFVLTVGFFIIPTLFYIETIVLGAILLIVIYGMKKRISNTFSKERNENSFIVDINKDIKKIKLQEKALAQEIAELETEIIERTNKLDNSQTQLELNQVGLKPVEEVGESEQEILEYIDRVVALRSKLSILDNSQIEVERKLQDGEKMLKERIWKLELKVLALSLSLIILAGVFTPFPKQLEKVETLDKQSFKAWILNEDGNSIALIRMKDKKVYVVDANEIQRRRPCPDDMYYAKSVFSNLFIDSGRRYEKCD